LSTHYSCPFSTTNAESFIPFNNLRCRSLSPKEYKFLNEIKIWHYRERIIEVFIICFFKMGMNTEIDWNEVIKKEARGNNELDLGEVQEVSNGLILVQRGVGNKEIFSIPQYKVESYDGKVLRFAISEEDALKKYIKRFDV
jgi:hypothetical protein